MLCVSVVSALALVARRSPSHFSGRLTLRDTAGELPGGEGTNTNLLIMGAWMVLAAGLYVMRLVIILLHFRSCKSLVAADSEPDAGTDSGAFSLFYRPNSLRSGESLDGKPSPQGGPGGGPGREPPPEPPAAM